MVNSNKKREVYYSELRCAFSKKNLSFKGGQVEIFHRNRTIFCPNNKSH